MVTLTLKNPKSGKAEIEYFNSLDKLRKRLSGIAKTDGAILVGTSILEGVSYDNAEEQSILRSNGIIPKEDEYVDSKR